MDKTLFSNHINLKNAVVHDDFWSAEMELIRREVIPYQRLALCDRIENAEKSYCIENFIKAGKIAKALQNGESVIKYPADKWFYDEKNSEEGAFHGWVFQDSDVYKWLEAVAYSLINHSDAQLEKTADEFIDIICEAQLENGYLNTHYIINDIDKAFTNLADHHELYCFGHLAEAAVSYFNATGKDKLLRCACHFADLICNTFGTDKIKGYPGHEIAEMALVRLYDVTKEKKYLDTAAFFIEERGKKPYYFDVERSKETVDDNYHYNQAHCQPRNQHEAVGHAVRGVYLYSGMADIARRFDDDGLLQACRDIWSNIENKKLYITGGIGATVDGEAFSFDYDLPNDLAYSETCASIGLIFFARRMLEIEADSRYADVAERALYNTVLSGMAEDGKSFFYVNPLEVLPEASHKDSRKRHIKPVRQKWFACACCPPNLARLISSLPEYCYGESSGTIYVHQYLGGDFEFDAASLSVKSTYSENGKVSIDVKTNGITLALRIPSWCDNFTISSRYEIKKGYAYINLSGNEHVEIEFTTCVRIIKCSNRVRASIGRVAVTKGPFVYCVEEADNGKNLHLLSLSHTPDFEVKGGFITANGFRDIADDILYSTYSPAKSEPCRIKFVPYFKWGNRGENEMSVYIRY